MKINLTPVLVLLTLFYFGCQISKPEVKINNDEVFLSFETNFLDAYWKEYPTMSIYNGYGKYYDHLVIPDSTFFINNVIFSKLWLDSLHTIDMNTLNDNNKISFNMIKNQLESDIWYRTVFKQHEWDASIYNVSGECDYILNQPYAPLDDRLKLMSQHLANTDDYYKTALNNLKNPTKEHLELAILQNQGGISFFETTLKDSIKVSNLVDGDREALNSHITKTIQAINSYVVGLKAMLQNKGSEFRDYRIGKDLFTQKFKFDLVTDFTPEQIYDKALEDKGKYHQKMYGNANQLWSKYYGKQVIPKDSIQLIQLVLDKIQLQHAQPKDFFDSLTSQVYQLKRFIIEKDLFDFDTLNPPVIVRYMPEYARGVTVASAEFAPPYQDKGSTYYNIDDLSKYSVDRAEGVLKEYNNYASQLLSIHEAIPGHCLQGIYNKKNSKDVLRAVFQNGAMIEGWAVYTEGMMIEEGWGNHSPEMELVHDKLKLRELANVLIDYDIQCLGKDKEYILNLLTKECFQTRAQAEEKYHRATVSQVQLCSYYCGSTAIQALREEYKKKLGTTYSLKNFHETFLSFGSSPVKYIRERMLN